MTLLKTYFFSLAFITFSMVSYAQTVVYYEKCDVLGEWQNTGKIYPEKTAGYNWLAVKPKTPSNDHTGGGGCFYVNGGYGYAEAHNPNYILYQIKSPAINLSGYDNCRLEFWMQMRSEVEGWDGGYLEYSTDGSAWTSTTSKIMCVPYDGNMSQNNSSTPFYNRKKPAWYNYRTKWTRVVIDISAVDNIKTFYLRFTFHSDEAEDNIGWAIDDIKIVSIAKPQVSGNGAVIEHKDKSPVADDHTDFGNIAIGDSVIREFTIKNIGEAPLTLTGSPFVTVTGSGFTIVSQPVKSVLDAGETTKFKVKFKFFGEDGLAPGIVNGTISIPNSDDYSTCNPPNPYTFAIVANGTY
jgi:hypothetical protein